MQNSVLLDLRNISHYRKYEAHCSENNESCHFPFYPYILFPPRNIVSFSVSKLPLILWSAFCPSSDHSCPKQCKNRHRKAREHRWKTECSLCPVYLLSCRDCTEERFIVAFVKYNPGLLMHTLLESQRQAKKEGKDSSFFQAPFRIKRTAPAIPLMNWWLHHTDLVNMQMLKGSSIYFYLLCQSNGPKKTCNV